jgi:hypothetical protein
VGGAELGGEAGMPAGLDCPSRSGGDWELALFPELRDATTQESHPFFRLTNLSGRTVALARIAIRYYFTPETDAAETAVCFWVTGDRCSLAQVQFNDVLPPTTDASRYLEVTFPSASTAMVFPGDFEVRIGFGIGSALMVQSNDYSFDPNADAPSAVAPFPYKRWLKTTLYVDGDLVWGTEPC